MPIVALRSDDDDVRTAQLNNSATYWLSEDDVAVDGELEQTGVLVDVADRFHVHLGGNQLHGLGDSSEAHRPRQRLTRRQQRLTEHAAIRHRNSPFNKSVSSMLLRRKSPSRRSYMQRYATSTV